MNRLENLKQRNQGTSALLVELASDKPIDTQVQARIEVRYITDAINQTVFRARNQIGQ
jgi:hypothetical protein